jgi:predicted HTH transcriptional regulator
MQYIESDNLELKAKYTDTICKEIVAFLNANGGQIIVGVNDAGDIIGVQKIDETLKKISDVITSQIEPNPQEEISSELKFVDGKTLVVLNISKGTKNIYCQKKYGFSSSGCVIRIGTTCKEMTPEQIRIRYEKNFYDDEYLLKKRASRSDLSFRELKIYYSEKGFHVDDNSLEANFNLRNKAGEYNLLAELLADKNNIPFNFVKFHGIDKSAMSERYDYGYVCILTVYERIKSRLFAENTCITNTTVRPRIDKYLFDYDAVNEAVLNALVHNDWTITEPQISFYTDRLEILSHGGLPSGMTKEEFFEGISRPRNSTLMRVFLNMGLTEHTGHGIPTIIKKYGKDVFEITDNYIKCRIPFDRTVLEQSQRNIVPNITLEDRLNKTEKAVIRLLIEKSNYSIDELSSNIGLTNRTIERALSSLQKKGKIERIRSKKTGGWLVIR